MTAPSTPDFRSEAQQALERAKKEMATDEEMRLRYAALELRMSMEALTYGRAAAYNDDFPLEEYADWQPRKVMSALIDLDPHADKGFRLQMGKHPVGSPEPAEWIDMGTERVLSLAEIKKHYDALGSWLHTPTIAQRRSAKATDMESLRSRCETVVQTLDEVLASGLWNFVFRQHASFDCDRCSNPIRAFRPLGVTTSSTTCRKCGAGYVLHGGKGEKSWWEADQVRGQCPKCKTAILLWRDEILQGALFACDECNSQLLVTMGIGLVNPDQSQTSSN